MTAVMSSRSQTASHSYSFSPHTSACESTWGDANKARGRADIRVPV